MIMVTNQKMGKDDKDMLGFIKVVRLYDMEKQKQSIQKNFYPIIYQMNNSSKSKNLATVNMPAIKCFALS